MTKTDSNTKRRTFTHLTEIERGQIAAYLDEGLSLREIARRMGRNVSTISVKEDVAPSGKLIPFVNPIRSIFRTLAHASMRKTVRIAELILS